MLMLTQDTTEHLQIEIFLFSCCSPRSFPSSSSPSSPTYSTFVSARVWCVCIKPNTLTSLRLCVFCDFVSQYELCVASLRDWVLACVCVASIDKQQNDTAKRLCDAFIEVSSRLNHVAGIDGHIYDPINSHRGCRDCISIVTHRRAVLF